jgi:hypothetical protein
MIRTKDQSAIKEGMLTAQETRLFIREVEEKCMKVDFIGLIEILNKYPLKNVNQEDYKDFIAQAKVEHHFWHKNPLEVKINAVQPFESRCIACSFGKTVKAFSVNFLKMKDNKLPGRLVYVKSFALNFEIINNALIDFGWCNAFLENEEMEEIQN